MQRAKDSLGAVALVAIALAVLVIGFGPGIDLNGNHNGNKKSPDVSENDAKLPSPGSSRDDIEQSQESSDDPVISQEPAISDNEARARNLNRAPVDYSHAYVTRRIYLDGTTSLLMLVEDGDQCFAASSPAGTAIDCVMQSAPRERARSARRTPLPYSTDRRYVTKRFPIDARQQGYVVHAGRFVCYVTAGEGAPSLWCRLSAT